jgi:hypothetical protein
MQRLKTKLEEKIKNKSGKQPKQQHERPGHGRFLAAKYGTRTGKTT